MNVSSILKRKGTHVETVRPLTPVGEAARLLTAKGIGSLAILDDKGDLLGVLSERDLVQALSEHGQSSSSLPVREIISAPSPTCKPEDSLRQVMQIMTVRRARHLPVIAGEALIGIISIGDVVKGLLEDLELEVGVLRDYARARLQ